MDTDAGNNFNNLATYEFQVKSLNTPCVEEIKEKIKDIASIQSYDIDIQNETITIATTLTSFQLKNLLESNGRQAVLKGCGNSTNSCSAVAEFKSGPVFGVARFIQNSSDSCVVEATFEGIAPQSQVAIFIHEYGDLSDGCKSCGDIFIPDSAFKQNSCKKDPMLAKSYVGNDSQASMRNVVGLQIPDIIGRSLILHSLTENSVLSHEMLSCAIIARSSGLFQNRKQICSCDGVVLWKERDVPLVGPGRRQADSNL